MFVSPIINNLTAPLFADSSSPIKIPDLKGKVAIVTGGNGGIGLETVRQLAQHGAKVYMASRTESKARAAIEELNKESPLDVHFIEIDLMKLSSAKTCAEQFLAKESRLDILITNAGVMAVPYKLTDDGIEQSFQVNHLTHFALFQQLAPLMAKTGKETGHPSRLINLSSFAVSDASLVGITHIKFFFSLIDPACLLQFI